MNDWRPEWGNNVRVVGDWSMAFGQVGKVIGIADVDEYIVQMDDGSQDTYELSDLMHPAAEWQPPLDDGDDDDRDDDYGLCSECGEPLHEQDIGFNEQGELYCLLCGQRIDPLDEPPEE